jgi:hypothetical protein
MVDINLRTIAYHKGTRHLKRAAHKASKMLELHKAAPNNPEAVQKDEDTNVKVVKYKVSIIDILRQVDVIVKCNRKNIVSLSIHLAALRVIDRVARAFRGLQTRIEVTKRPYGLWKTG